MTLIGPVGDPRICMGIIEKAIIFLLLGPESDHVYDWSVGSHASSFSEWRIRLTAGANIREDLGV